MLPKKKKKVPVIKGLKLHKVGAASTSSATEDKKRGGGGGEGGEPKTVEEWNSMREKLGLKPLKE